MFERNALAGFGVNPSVLLLSKIAKALGKKLEIRFV